jgi:hypothetical protein
MFESELNVQITDVRDGCLGLVGVFSILNIGGCLSFPYLRVVLFLVFLRLFGFYTEHRDSFALFLFLY